MSTNLIKTELENTLIAKLKNGAQIKAVHKENGHTYKLKYSSKEGLIICSQYSGNYTKICFDNLLSNFNLFELVELELKL